MASTDESWADSTAPDASRCSVSHLPAHSGDPQSSCSPVPATSTGKLWPAWRRLSAAGRNGNIATSTQTSTSLSFSFLYVGEPTRFPQQLGVVQTAVQHPNCPPAWRSEWVVWTPWPQKSKPHESQCSNGLAGTADWSSLPRLPIHS